MTTKSITLKSLSLAALLASASACLLSAPASAYTACNKDGDCWHTDTRVTFPGVTLSVHDDKWWDANRNDSRYHWHEADKDHDYHNGYWDHGAWHSK